MSDERPANALHWSRLEVANPTIVLFSGGRDSTLAVLHCLLRGEYPVLCVFDTGLGLCRDVLEFRLQELASSVGRSRFEVARIPIYGLVRSVAILPLVEDIIRDGVNLIPLGESLAMHAGAVVLARRLGARHIVNGFTGYQSHLPEQGADALRRLSAFISEYQLTLDAPLYGINSVQDVQYELLEYGISPKSLEGISILADTCGIADAEVVARYMDHKLPILRGFIARLTVERGPEVSSTGSGA